MTIKISETKNVPEYMPNKPKIFRELLATITVTLSVMSCGIHYSWPSPTLPKLLAKDSYIPINDAQGSWLAVTTLIFALFTAPLAADLVDRYGRKISTMLTIPLYLISWFCIGFGRVYYIILLGRCIAGIADGITYTAVLVYVGEIASCRIRGFLASFISVILLFSGLIVNSVGPFVSIQTMAFICAVVPLVQLILCIFLPESPYYLLMKEDTKAAKESLQYLRGGDSANITQELEDIKSAVKRQMSERGSYKDLVVQPGNFRALLICIGLRTSQQLSGISAVIFYSQIIFAANNEFISATTAVIIFNALQVITACFSSLILDRLGRKILYSLSSAGCAITLGATAIYFYLKQHNVNVSEYFWIPMVSLCSFIVTYNMGMSVIPVTMLSELFPTNVKSKALAVMDMYFSLIASLMTKLFQHLDSTYGMYVPFTLFACSCILGVVFGIVYLPETKNKTLEEIQMMLRRKTISRNSVDVKPVEVKKNQSDEDVSTYI
ncbi:facilitated trehalose transporter Tret1-like [Chrysoperla carnea]|uniref:facilitated trehalose transporter Tret1-like n=1 Tax=Chrysoperla carnea TaxID=189513 RepID=UPI001D097B63|nr:facilitated trehalose transporter Tret1-like [Chrysoperla carnea]